MFTLAQAKKSPFLYRRRDMFDSYYFRIRSIYDTYNSFRTIAGVSRDTLRVVLASRQAYSVTRSYKDYQYLRRLPLFYSYIFIVCGRYGGARFVHFGAEVRRMTYFSDVCACCRLDFCNKKILTHPWDLVYYDGQKGWD